MKIFFSIILLMSFTTHTEFKKRVLPYGIVISKADLIVEGIVASKKENSYKFNITEFIKGESPKAINVSIWNEWSCDKRVKAIENNQRLLLFLQKDGMDYSVINGSTGELFILSDENVETFTKNDFPKITEVKEGIRLFLKSYEYKGDLYPNIGEESYFVRLIKQSKIKMMKKENMFMEFLVLQIKNYLIKD